MKGPKLSLVVLICASLALLAACTPAPQAAPPATPLPPTSTPAPPTPTPVPPTATVAPAAVPEVLKTYVEAFNRRDLDAAMALFVDEGLSYMETGEFATTYKSELRNFVGFEMGEGVVYEIDGCVSDGGKYRCWLVNKGDCTETLFLLGVMDQAGDGRDPLIVTTEDGKIRTMTLELDQAMMARFSKALPTFVEWIKTNMPDDYPAMMSYSRANGELWSKACKTYAAGHK